MLDHLKINPGAIIAGVNANFSPPIGVSIAQACVALGIGRTSLYKLIADGKLGARKIGRRTVILAEELRAYAEALPVIAPRLGGRHVAERSASKTSGASSTSPLSPGEVSS